MFRIRVYAGKAHYAGVSNERQLNVPLNGTVRELVNPSDGLELEIASRHQIDPMVFK